MRHGPLLGYSDQGTDSMRPMRRSSLLDDGGSNRGVSVSKKVDGVANH